MAGIARGYRTTYCWPGKTSKFKMQSPISTGWVSLSHHRQVEKSLSRTTVSWGPSVPVFTNPEIRRALFAFTEKAKIAFSVLFCTNCSTGGVHMSYERGPAEPRPGSHTRHLSIKPPEP